MRSRIGKKGFTLVELLIVIGMLMLLVGAITTSVSGAYRRAKIQQATVEAQEMTKAILAYENYGELEEMDGPAEESKLDFILGKKKLEGGSGKVPVLFNASISGGMIRDPWGNPYRVTIKENEIKPEDRNSLEFKSHVFLPNYNRRPADEWAAALKGEATK